MSITQFSIILIKMKNLEKSKFLRSCEHFNDCTTNTPYVSSAAVSITFDDLRRHPEHGPSDRLEPISLCWIMKSLKTKEQTLSVFDHSAEPNFQLSVSMFHRPYGELSIVVTLRASMPFPRFHLPACLNHTAGRRGDKHSLLMEI